MLTQKQEKFVLEYIKCGNASDAYRASYDTSNMKPETVNRQAKAQMDHPKISARIKELQKATAKKAEISLESHLNDLKILRNLATKDGKWAAAVQAEIARGKAAGLYIEKIDVSGRLNLDMDLSKLTEDQKMALASVRFSDE